MKLEEYQQEYERLFKWRERWTRLSNKHEPGRLQVRQERIEERASISNNRILALMRAYDAELMRPYLADIEAFVSERGCGVYRQDIVDNFQTPGRTNAHVIGDAIGELERRGVLARGSGPCSVHKGPLLTVSAKSTGANNEQ